MKSFIHVVYEAGNVGPAIKLCAGLSQRSGLQAVIFCPYYLPDTDKYIRDASSSGVLYLHQHNEVGGVCDLNDQLNNFELSSTSDLKFTRPLFSLFRQRIISFLFAQVFPDKLASFSSIVDSYTRQINFFANLVNSLRSQFIIFAEDNVERDSHCWIRVAKIFRIQTLIVTYGSLTPDEAAIAYFSNPQFCVSSTKEKFIMKIFKKWVRPYGGKKMIRLPIERLFALEALNLVGRKPWIVNSNDVNHLVLESDFMKDMYETHGVVNNIRVCGSPSLDRLHAAHQRFRSSSEFRLNYFQSATKPTLLCALPPNQYPGVFCPEADGYKDLVELWLSLLDGASEAFNILVSLHPTSDQDTANIVRSSGAYVQKGGVTDLLPHTDLYLASVSSTIRWALIYCVPVINFDCYQYKHKDYMGVQGVQTCDSSEKARDVIRRFAIGSELFVARQSLGRLAQYYGKPDGNSVEKIFELLK